MKRTIMFILAFAILFGGGSVYVSANGNTICDTIPIVSIEYIPLYSDLAMGIQNIGITDAGIGNGLRNYPVFDLGVVNLNWTINAKSTIRSSNNYTTASGKLVFRVSGSPIASVIFYIYDSTDSLVVEKTVQLTPSTIAIITFSNLFTNKQYYVRAENVSQGTTTVTGTLASS